MVWYGKTEYKNSEKMTANAIKAAFSKFSNTIYISENCTGGNVLICHINGKCTYYVEPEILHW